MNMLIANLLLFIFHFLQPKFQNGLSSISYKIPTGKKKDLADLSCYDFTGSELFAEVHQVTDIDLNA